MPKVSLSYLALLVGVSIALTGCVGVPLSSEVQSGPLIDEQDDAQYEIVASGPVAGSTQEQILTDFMSAVRSPSRDYSVAREFLTSSMSETWNPAASATVREVDKLPTIAAAADDDALTYSFSAQAVIDEGGVYAELRSPVSQTLAFEFEQIAGEWRISAAPPGIVLSDRGFEVSFEEQVLYYFDPSFAYLIPDVRWFAVRQSSQSRAIQALLAADSAWVQQGVLLTAFPQSTTLGATSSLTSGRAVVDLSSEALAADTVARERMRQQLSATLHTPIVELTVDGRDLQSTSSGQTAAVIEPASAGPLVVGTGSEFGFSTSDGLTELNELSTIVVDAGATSAALSADRLSVAYLDSEGSAYFASVGVAPRLIDARSGLIAPSLDPFRFVWSAQNGSATSLSTFEVDGTEHPLQTTLPADSEIVSLDVSRDGARLLVYLSTPSGPQLLVYGIVRQQGNVPVQLVDPVSLPVREGSVIDAAWVGSSTVATLSGADDSVSVTAYSVGGPSTDLGTVAGATQLVSTGANTDGLRVLAGGEVWRPQGSQAWVLAGLDASFMASQQ
ncbi:LpqB family beta-propeller domain-containing protein [Salinibacterium sp. NK8237]|uniref:LpqB family beta-propeller domain-containing protein n=1 Tax=Salinibacterium sp. NK8237 TaxID=2792038 RepID=UPI0018CEC602|nr:LpqB family beta-propeller domain-containing protein [Salinibacterium sp. NK8237]MBH0129606.1 GerMN domain-containing protein [Salinibacterium sp. NK8237]